MTTLEAYDGYRVHLPAFIPMAEPCREIDPTAEHVAGMLADAYVDVVVALWPKLSAPDGVGLWVVKGRAILEAVVKNRSIAQVGIMQSTKFEFVINLNTAKAFGLSFPSALLAIADEVIE